MQSIRTKWFINTAAPNIRHFSPWCFPSPVINTADAEQLYELLTPGFSKVSCLCERLHFAQNSHMCPNQTRWPGPNGIKNFNPGIFRDGILPNPGIPGFFGTGFSNIFDPGILGKTFGIFIFTLFACQIVSFLSIFIIIIVVTICIALLPQFSLE